MEDVLNATLAGGVCIGASCDVIINAWVSIAVGFGIGIISCLGFNFVTPKLNKSLHDTCGVLNVSHCSTFFSFLLKKKKAEN